MKMEEPPHQRVNLFTQMYMDNSLMEIALAKKYLPLLSKRATITAKQLLEQFLSDKGFTILKIFASCQICCQTMVYMYN